MKRKVFYSFHFGADSWRASQVRNMGLLEGDEPVSDNEWEEITGGGDDAISSWINEQMKGKSCAIVLIGAKTAGRKWIKFEIEKAWNAEKGVLGIYIHNLRDLLGEQSAKGKNPFDDFTMKRDDKTSLSSIVKAYDPPYKDSKKVYDHIKDNLWDWVEEAITIRSEY